MPFAREHHSSPANDEFRCAVLKEYFAGKRFDQITTMLVEKYIEDRLRTETVRVVKTADGEKVAKRRAPTTVNKEVVLLSSIFNMAKHERLAAENPCDFIRKSVRKKIPARVIRNRYLTLEEEQGLFANLSGRRDILGHSAATMTGSYTHSSPQAMEMAMAIVADYSREKIFSLTAKSRQAV